MFPLDHVRSLVSPRLALLVCLLLILITYLGAFVPPRAHTCDTWVGREAVQLGCANDWAEGASPDKHVVTQNMPSQLCRLMHCASTTWH